MNLRLKCKLHACTAIACTFMMAFSSLTVCAEDINDMQNKKSELQNQLNSINSELDKISGEITDLQMQMEVTEAEIQRTKDALADAKEKEDAQYKDMKVRIQYMYESGNTTLLQLLFSAKNMSDFLNKADFIQNISSYDRDMLKELKDIRQDIADQKETLDEQKASFSDLKDELNTKQTELQAKAKETSTNLAEYEKKIAEAQAAEEARKQAEAAAAAAAAGSSGNRANTSGTPTNNGSNMNVSASELDVFAAILDCEAIQDYNSMLAVATVIMNRVNSSSFPNSISGVVYAPGQFQPVWTGKLERKIASGPSSLAYQVAKAALGGARLSEVSNCYYFLYAPSTGRAGVVIGDNLFFPSW